MSGIPFTDDELYLVWRLGCSDAEAREAVRELREAERSAARELREAERLHALETGSESSAGLLDGIPSPFIVLNGDTLLILSLIGEDAAVRVREFLAAREGHDVTTSPEWLARLEELRPWVETRLRELREESGDG